MTHRLFGGMLVLSLMIMIPACGHRAPASHEAGPAVKTPALGFELASLPDGLKIASNGNGAIVLVPAKKGEPGTITIDELPPDAGVELLDAVHAHQASISHRPDGKYFGAQELRGPLGTAYWSRGRYTKDGAPVEETVIFTLRPDGTRIVRLRYVYPAGGDSQTRVKTLLDVLGEIEALKPVTKTP